MGEDKFALLVRNKNNLELKVSHEKDATDITLGFDQSELREIIPDEVGVIGCIAFKDNRTSKEILQEFLSIYLGASNIKSPKKPIPLFIEYPLLFEPIITKAFVYYFSKLNKKKVESNMVPF